MSLAIAFSVGGATWTLGEYVLHRGLMHQLRGRGMASYEHLKHHAIRGYYANTRDKLLTAAGVTALLFPLTWPLLGAAGAGSFCAGFSVAYLAYEVLHRRAHTHPPRTRYGRWLRKSHLTHHFVTPHGNFGVTTPIWDRIFGTLAPVPDRVPVPRRYATNWMLDGRGELDSRWSRDYVLTGSRDTDTTRCEQDRGDAFANRAPAA